MIGWSSPKDFLDGVDLGVIPVVGASVRCFTPLNWRLDEEILTMTSDACFGGMAQFISQMSSFKVVPHLLRTIARGAPVSIQTLADEGEFPVADVETMFRGQPGTDWDEEGRLIGFGLTLRPTAHRYTVGGRLLYTFCATDALLFTHILGEPAVAESICPVTAQPIRIELMPSTLMSVDPPSAVVSQVLFDPNLTGDIRRNVCDEGLFFASAYAASGWTSQHPEGQVSTISEAFERSRVDVETLGWLP